MTASEPTTVEKLRALPWAVASNALLSPFLQFTFFGSVFVLFLDELGLSKGQMGFVLSLLPFTALIALPIAPAVARFGYKRSYVLFFLARSVAAAGLLLTPWILANFGPGAAVAYVAFVVLVFALLRTVGVTASFPWIQEYVPNSVRGRYSASTNVFSTLTAFLAVAAASFVLARSAGLNGFMALIAVGVFFGIVSALASARIPGGAPISADQAAGSRRDLRSALRDANFTRYLVGLGLFTLATVPLASFVPLFMRDEVGLSQANVVSLQNGAMLGVLASSFVWGWFADRYGSKPIMQYGILLRLLVVLGWVLMPRHSPVSLAIALAIAFLQGVADVGWGVGSSRLLYVDMVPPAKKADYMALYWAWTGLTAGLSQLIGGRLLDVSQQAGAQAFGPGYSPYTPLFLIGLVLPLVTILVFRRLRDTSVVGMGHFIGLLFRGNLLLAVEAVIRYHRTKDEQAAILATEKLGAARSLLAEEELLDSLADPRFNVRFEALVSIARMSPDERLVAAVVEVLHGNEPALSTVAAWTLGRLGHELAREPLRQALVSSPYRSVRAHSSRSLGALGDGEIVGLLLDRLKEEKDEGLRLAFASTLGQLGAREAVGPLLATLRWSREEAARMELALALARIVGEERHFVQLLRQARREAGTAAAQEVLTLRKRVDPMVPEEEALGTALDQCAGTLARNELDCGLAQLSRCIRLVPREQVGETERQILRQCALRLEEFGAGRIEYAILALHTLAAGWKA